MKKFLAMLLAAVMVLSCVSALADDAKVLAGQSLRIGLSPTFMYFETQNEAGEYEGLDIDIINQLSDMLGFEYEIVPMDFSSLIGSLQTKDLDMVISGLSYTDERAQVVDFSMTYCTTDVGCVTKVDSGIASTEDLKGKVVCCSQGTTYEILLENMGVDLRTFQGTAAVGAAVLNGQDGVVAGVTSINGAKKLAMQSEGQMTYFMLDGEGTADQYNIAFQKGSALTAEVDKAIQELIDNGWLAERIQSWLY